MSHSIVWDQDINSISNKLQNNRKMINENMEKIKKRIEHETFFEKKELEKAVLKYNKKVEKILNEKEMVNYTKIVKEKSEENFTLANRAFQYYQSKHEEIQNNNLLSPQEKIKQEKNLLISIGNNLLSDEAKGKFQSLVENNNGDNMILLIN